MSSPLLTFVRLPTGGYASETSRRPFIRRRQTQRLTPCPLFDYV